MMPFYVNLAHAHKAVGDVYAYMHGRAGATLKRYLSQLCLHLSLIRRDTNLTFL